VTGSSTSRTRATRRSSCRNPDRGRSALPLVAALSFRGRHPSAGVLRFRLDVPVVQRRGRRLRRRRTDRPTDRPAPAPPAARPGLESRRLPAGSAPAGVYFRSGEHRRHRGSCAGRSASRRTDVPDRHPLLRLLTDRSPRRQGGALLEREFGEPIERVHNPMASSGSTSTAARSSTPARWPHWAHRSFEQPYPRHRARRPRGTERLTPTPELDWAGSGP
jgi:hypothetical protein